MADERSRSLRRRSGDPLTPDAVVGAAVELVDEVGLSGFTTRALADRLGTYPATLYWHVGNRTQLIATVVDRVIGEMKVPDPSSMSWQEWLRAAAHEYRRVVHRHPNIAPVLVSPLVVSAPATRLVESVLSVLEAAGFRGPALASAFNVFVGSVVGWVSLELAADPSDIGPDWRDTFAATVRDLPEEEFPVIAAHREHLADQVFALRWHGGTDRPLDASFAVAVDAWITGLVAQLPG